MTDQIVETAPARPMTAAEATLAQSIYQSIQWHTTRSERAQQAADFKAGISDLGFCSERLRRMLKQMHPDDVDMLPAAIGIAVGSFVEEAVLAHGTAAWIRQPKVTVVLRGDGGTYHVTGHPDLIDPAGLVVDVKTSRGLSGPERTGPSQQQQFQRHCYAAGAHAAGLFDEGLALEDVRVANFWLDRAADDRYPYVHMEPFSHAVVEQATWWLDEVVYCYTHDLEARKEPPRDMCFKVCGFAKDCRGRDIPDEQGLINDPDLVAAVNAYREGIELEKAGKRLKDQSKAALDGIHGSTGEFAVSWTKVTGGHVEYDRKPGERLTIRPIK